MLKRFVHWLAGSRLTSQVASRRKPILDHENSVFNSDLSFRRDDFSLMIIHAGGVAELFQSSIPASLLLDKYPGMCIARPEVFKHPHESLVSREEMLLPGHKFYLIPRTAVRKLKRKFPQKLHKEEVVVRRGLDDEAGGPKLVDGGGFDSFSDDESVCSAKDFFISKDKWSSCLQTKCRSATKKPPFNFTPPIKRSRTWHRLEWQPSLTSVQELSP